MAKFLEIISSGKPVLVDFYEGSEVKSNLMIPVITRLKDFVGEHVTVLKVNLERNPSIADKYQIHDVPTFVIFKNGKIKWQRSGVTSLETLKQQLLLNS